MGNVTHHSDLPRLYLDSISVDQKGFELWVRIWFVWIVVEYAVHVAAYRQPKMMMTQNAHPNHLSTQNTKTPH